MRRGVAIGALALSLLAPAAPAALAQSCPAPLQKAQRLLLVTAASMNATAATLHLFERDAPNAPWRAVGDGEPALIGKAGMGWSHFFRHLARPGEPIKVEGDKRAPAGVYAVGRGFGTLPSSRPNYLHVTPDTVCVNDVASPAYNSVTSRTQISPKAHVENMSQALPMYRRGLLLDYPTDARARAGSCIFLHVWRNAATGTAGCVALPEPRVEALQDFTEGGAAIAILPRHALDRLGKCLPPLPRSAKAS